MKEILNKTQIDKETALFEYVTYMKFSGFVHYDMIIGVGGITSKKLVCTNLDT